MNCPRCKTVVTQQDKYCPSCGLPLEAARAGGASPKKPAGKSKAYEEASTQLLDVDEFRKYMADERSKSGPGAAPTPAQGMAASANLSRGGNLAGDVPPSAAPARNLAGPPAAENPDLVATRLATPVKPPAPRPESVSPMASRPTADMSDSFPAPKNNTTVVIAAVVAVIAVALLAYKFLM
jgi:hypothetical protein